jgi:hypothetical protein
MMSLRDVDGPLLNVRLDLDALEALDRALTALDSTSYRLGGVAGDAFGRARQAVRETLNNSARPSQRVDP